MPEYTLTLEDENGKKAKLRMSSELIELAVEDKDAIELDIGIAWMVKHLFKELLKKDG